MKSFFKEDLGTGPGGGEGRKELTRSGTWGRITDRLKSIHVITVN